MPKNKNNIRVFARFRPPNSRDNKSVAHVLVVSLNTFSNAKACTHMGRLSAASRASAIDLDPENSSLSIKGIWWIALSCNFGFKTQHDGALVPSGSGAKFQYDTVFSPKTDQAVLNEVNWHCVADAHPICTMRRFSNWLILFAIYCAKEGGKALRPDGSGRIQFYDLCLRPNRLTLRHDHNTCWRWPLAPL